MDTFENLIEFLGTHPAALGEKALRRHTTHISEVFVGEETVYKFKRPVRYAFIDQREISTRLDFCRREVELNRRLSHGVYRGVNSVVETGDAFRRSDNPEAGEPCVVMKRLEDRDRLIEILKDKRATDAMAAGLAYRLADFHGECERAAEGLHDVAARLRENLEALGTLPRVDSVWRTRVGDYFEARRPLIEKREKAGRIVDGHGDLRLDHIYGIGGDIQVLDCVEFSPAIRAVDPYEDLAFTTMGAQVEGFGEWGARLAREYAAYSGDAEGLILLPFFELYRATVRAKIDLYLSREGAASRRTYYAERLNGYLRFAEEILTGGRHQGVRKLVVVGGLPATGKSTYARELSHELKVPLLSTDVVRKRMRALRPTERAPADAYSPEAKARIYEVCRDQAETLLRSGWGVILDGTFAREDQRQSLVRMGDRLGCRVEFHEVTASEEIIRRRLEGRAEGPSDLRDFETWRRLRDAFEPMDPATLPGYRRVESRPAREV